MQIINQYKNNVFKLLLSSLQMTVLRFSGGSAHMPRSHAYLIGNIDGASEGQDPPN